jgi:uncharacterized membrane protein
VPFGLLALAYWLHMAATVVWIGGLVFQSLILAPVIVEGSDVLDRVRRRFEPVAWLSLAVLIGTGLMQMTASPQYTGFLAIDSTWSAAILAKHIVIGGMVLLAGYQTWGLQPQLARLKLAASRSSQDPAAVEALRRRRRRLLRVETVASVLVLALTAVARSA